MRMVPYPHPGEILLEEFLKPMGIRQDRLSKGHGASLAVNPPWTTA